MSKDWEADERLAKERRAEFYHSNMFTMDDLDDALQAANARITELEAQLAEAQRERDEACIDKDAAILNVMFEIEELTKQRDEAANDQGKAESEARRLLHIIKQAATSLTEWDEEYNDDCSTPAPIQFAMDRLQAALTPEAWESPWRPIATAPRDGTLILLYPTNGNGLISTGYRHLNDDHWSAGCGWFNDGEVSHWMPIPEARECPMCDGTEQQHMGDCLLGLVDRESEEG